MVGDLLKAEIRDIDHKDAVIGGRVDIRSAWVVGEAHFSNECFIAQTFVSLH